jgi:hypothetical protein
MGIEQNSSLQCTKIALFPATFPLQPCGAISSTVSQLASQFALQFEDNVVIRGREQTLPHAGQVAVRRDTQGDIHARRPRAKAGRHGHIRLSMQHKPGDDFMQMKQSAVRLRTALHALGTTAGGAMAMSLMTLAPVQAVHAQATCAAAWSASTVYTGGQTASENGTNYLANWWTQGNDPATNSGGPGSGQPWTSQGACTGGSSGGGGTGGGGTGGGGTGGGGTGGGGTGPTNPPGTGANLVFSPYKDITINLNWNTNVMQTAAATGSSIPVVGSGSLKSN